MSSLSAGFLAGSLLRDYRQDRDLGEAHVLLKQAGDATTSHSLSGRLYRSKSGWGLLSVPNALVRGAFSALHEIGAELPLKDGTLNAHISVFREEELESLGGADKVNEWGKSFRFTLGPLKTCVPDGWKDVAQVWMIEVSSPELSKLRRSYGLTDLPKYPFHITIAIRRKGTVAHNSEVSKAAAEKCKHYKPGSGECCPHCCACLERDPYSGKCNTCGGDWPQEKSAAFEKLADILQPLAVGAGLVATPLVLDTAETLYHRATYPRHKSSPQERRFWWQQKGWDALPVPGGRHIQHLLMLRQLGGLAAAGTLAGARYAAGYRPQNTSKLPGKVPTEKSAAIGRSGEPCDTPSTVTAHEIVWQKLAQAMLGAAYAVATEVTIDSSVITKNKQAELFNKLATTLADLDAPILGDAAERNPMDIWSEEGFAGAYRPELEADQRSLALAALGLPAIAYLTLMSTRRKAKRRKKLASLWSALPRVRVFDTIAGGLPGAAIGAGINVLRERFKKDKHKRDYSGAAMTGAGIGGLLGATAGNVIGDRTRRYLTNTVPVIGTGYRLKDEVTPFNADGRTINWNKLYTAAIEDKPFTSVNRVDVMSPDVDREAADRALRYELFRRQLGVHTSSNTDVLTRNKDSTYSINPNTASGNKVLQLLLPPNEQKPDLRTWLSHVNDPSKSNIGGGLLRDTMGGQVVTSAPFGDRDIVTQNDRWDYTLRPYERSKLWSGLLAKLRGDTTQLALRADPKVDYVSVNDTVNDQTNSLLSRYLMDKIVVDHNPWLSHRFLVNFKDGGNTLDIQPRTGDGGTYAQPNWRYQYNPSLKKYELATTASETK